MALTDPISKLQQAVDEAVGYASGVRSRLLVGTEVLDPDAHLSTSNLLGDLHVTAVAAVDPAILGSWCESFSCDIAYSISMEEDGSVSFGNKDSLGGRGLPLGASGVLIPLKEGLEGQLFLPNGDLAAEVRVRLRSSDEGIGKHSVLNIRRGDEVEWGQDQHMFEALPTFDSPPMFGDFYWQDDDVVRGISLPDEAYRSFGFPSWKDVTFDKAYGFFGENAGAIGISAGHLHGMPLSARLDETEHSVSIADLDFDSLIEAHESRAYANAKLYLDLNKALGTSEPQQLSFRKRVSATAKRSLLHATKPSKHNKSRPVLSQQWQIRRQFGARKR